MSTEMIKKINNIMETIYLDDFLDDGIIKEKSFREKVSAINWQDYNSKRVMIKGCTSVPVPTWAYLILTAQLSQFADDIVYGEPCSTVKIFKRKS